MRGCAEGDGTESAFDREEARHCLELTNDTLDAERRSLTVGEEAHQHLRSITDEETEEGTHWPR